MLVNWEVVKSRDKIYCSDLHLYEINKCLYPNSIKIIFKFSSIIVLGEIHFSPVSLLVSSWRGAVCGQSTLVQRPAASRRPPDRGLSCSSGTCAAAHWRPHMQAWPGKGRRRDGWPQAGVCPGLNSCRRVVALRRWRTSRGQGSGERSPFPPHMTPALNSAGRWTSRTGRVCIKWWFTAVIRHETHYSKSLGTLDNITISPLHLVVYKTALLLLCTIISQPCGKCIMSAEVYLKADFLELRLDLFHQTHVPAVDKVLSTPLL